MRYDFDRLIERRGTDSTKWAAYEADVLPLWVADMDFPSPQPVVDALKARAAHGLYGYGSEPHELRAVVGERLRKRFGWQIDEGSIQFLPGVVPGFNLACRAYGEPGDGVLIQPPIYPPILAAPGNAGRECIAAPLARTDDGYEIDFDAFERAITPRTRLFLFCNPHNPTGRVFTEAELRRLADICIKRDLIVCSDEIHMDFVFTDHRHIPFASLGPEVAERTITLLAPSKTYNIAGLQCSLVLIDSPALRDRLNVSAAGLYDTPVNLFGYIAALAAYKEGDDWLAQVLAYLRGNRDFVLRYLADHLPAVKVFEPQGTFLAWLDFRATGISGDVAQFFLENARVALQCGPCFGAEGEGFARLNFGCPRRTLEEALARMHEALARIQ